MASGDTTTSGDGGLPRAIADLEAKNRDLTRILDALGGEQTTEETLATTALHDFVAAEASLIDAGNALAGPSPNFLAPSWEGASDPKRASYRKAFEPIIRKALAELTVAQLEGKIFSDELLEDLEEFFRSSAEDLNVFGGTPSEPDLETLFLEWMADSVILAGSSINASRQKAIQNGLIKMVKANLPNLAAWQKSPADPSATPVTGGLDYVWKGFIVPAITGALKNSGSTIDVANETKNILGALNQTFKKLTADMAGDEESVRAWIQNTIFGPFPGPELSDEKKQELVADLEDEVTRLFPQPDRITFYDTFSTLLEQQLYDPSLLGPSAGKSSRGGSSGGATDPNAAVTAVTTTISGLKLKLQSASDDLTKAKSDLAGAPATISRTAKAKLVQAVDQKQAAYDALTDQLDQANIDLVAAQAKVAEDPLEAVALKDRATRASDLAQQLKDLQDQLDSVDDGDDDAKADLENQIADARKNLDELTKQPGGGKKNVDGGLKGLLEGFADDAKVGDDVKAEWQTQVRDEVRRAVKQVLISMSEHGVQGRLLSTTYDYQVVTRVSEYSKAALAQLTADLDVEIPDNADLALTAAKKVTAAMTSVREFSERLGGFADHLKGEMDSGAKGGARGASPNIVASLVNGGQYANRYSIKDLPGLGRALFLSDRQPKPAIKQAEYLAVQLAAKAAGLKTSLQRLLDTEKSDALASLQTLTQAYSKLFDAEAAGFSATAATFFTSLGAYIDKRFAFENDQNDLEALRKATVELFDVMDKGILDYLPGETRKS